MGRGGRGFIDVIKHVAETLRLAGRMKRPVVVPVALASRDASSHQLRRARTGVTLTFALAGGLLGVFTARIPALVEKLTLSTAQLSTVLVVWGVGAIVITQALRFVMARVGSGSVLRIAAPLYPLSAALVASAPTYGLLLLGVATFGMAFSAIEVAAQAQGSTLERACGRPLLGGMHAAWPVGAGVGGLSAALCAQLGVSYSWCLGGTRRSDRRGGCD
jgi:predicted MFS family arabinose efflux permease